MVGGKGLRAGVIVNLDMPASGGLPVTAEVIAELDDGGRIVRFNRPVEEWLDNLGHVPLPPYIHEPLADPERYQTVYGRVEGSVASSTAGSSPPWGGCRATPSCRRRWRATPMPTCPCRSASTRPSRNPSWSP